MRLSAKFARRLALVLGLVFLASMAWTALLLSSAQEPSPGTLKVVLAVGMIGALGACGVLTLREAVEYRQRGGRARLGRALLGSGFTFGYGTFAVLFATWPDTDSRSQEPAYVIAIVLSCLLVGIGATEATGTRKGRR